MKSLYAALVCLLLGTYTVSAQHRSHDDHARNEIGVSTGAFYAIDDKGWGSGVHLHYFRTLKAHNWLAIGGFAEQAWLDGRHFSAGAGAKFKCIERVWFGVFPGVTFTKHSPTGHAGENEKTKARFSLHTELVYDLFEWDRFHAGPVFDYAWSKNDSHITLGVHVAYCF